MWYNKIVKDITVLPDFIDYYQAELKISRNEIKCIGKLDKNLVELPGITEIRFRQLQEIEAVLNYLNIQSRTVKQKHYKKYLEAYGRALSSRDAERYSEAEQEVIDQDLIINEVALLRNQYLAVLKALESKNFMLGHMAKLRIAGLEATDI